MFEDDLIWYKSLFEKGSDILDKHQPKKNYSDDPYYNTAMTSPEEYVKMLVNAAGLEKIKSTTNGERLFSEEDILRIINFITPEKVKRYVHIRKASHILNLASSPFLKIHLSGQWAESFRKAKTMDISVLKKSDSENYIRVLLSAISQLLIEGFDLVFHSSFNWDIPPNINNLFDKYSYILDNELIPTEAIDKRFKKPRYKELFQYLDKLRRNPFSLGGALAKRKSISKRFCECIKKVRSKVTVRNKGSNEGAAIAICTKSVLHSKGKTFRKFKCSGKRPYIRLRKWGLFEF